MLAAVFIIYVEHFSPTPMLDIILENELQDLPKTPMPTHLKNSQTLPHHTHRSNCEIVPHIWLLF